MTLPGRQTSAGGGALPFELVDAAHRGLRPDSSPLVLGAWMMTPHDKYPEDQFTTATADQQAETGAAQD